MKKMLLITKDEVKVVEVNGLDDYYKLIECDTIDIAYRSIGGKAFDIICDDEGLLKESRRVSAVKVTGEPALVGNLIVCGEADEEGEETSLTEADIELIKENIVKAMFTDMTVGNLLIIKEI